MSLEKGKNLSNLLSILRGTYKSIDMRAVLAKDLSLKNDKTWYCVFLKILLTNQELVDVQHEHVKRQLRNKYKRYFRVVFDCKPIDQIENILKEIKEGKINVNGVLSKPIGHGFDTILNKEMINDSDFNNDEESNTFSSNVACIPMQDFPMSAIEKFGIRKHEIDLTTSELEYYLGISSISKSINIVVILPIYCKRLPIPVGDEGKYLAIFRIHKDLVKSIVAKIRISPDGYTADTKDIISCNFKSIDRDQNVKEMITARLKSVAEPKDHIEITISHKKLPSMRLMEHFWAHETPYEKEP